MCVLGNSQRQRDLSDANRIPAMRTHLFDGDAESAMSRNPFISSRCRCLCYYCCCCCWRPTPSFSVVVVAASAASGDAVAVSVVFCCVSAVLLVASPHDSCSELVRSFCISTFAVGKGARTSCTRTTHLNTCSVYLAYDTCGQSARPHRKCESVCMCVVVYAHLCLRYPVGLHAQFYRM